MRRLSCTWSRLTLTRALRSQHSFSPILQMKSPRLRAGGCPVRRKLGMQTRQRLRLKSYLFWYLLSQQMSLHILGSGCSYEMLFYLAIIWSILSLLKMERAQRPLFSAVPCWPRGWQCIPTHWVGAASTRTFTVASDWALRSSIKGPDPGSYGLLLRHNSNWSLFSIKLKCHHSKYY